MNTLLTEGGLALLGLFLLVQIADLAASILDIRGAALARDGRRDRRRYARNSWLLPVTTVLGIALIVGVDIAARLILVGNQLVQGLLVLLGLSIISLAYVLVLITVASPRESATYASVRSEAVALGSRRASKKQIERLRHQLATLDDRARNQGVGKRNTVRQRRLRRDIESLARLAHPVSREGLSVLGTATWNMVSQFLLGRSWWRLVPFVYGVALFIAILDRGNILSTVGAIPLAVVLPVAVLGSLAIALYSTKASLGAKVAWQAVGLSERAEIEVLIANLERTSRRGVAGLGDRVARALQILREQQG